MSWLLLLLLAIEKKEEGDQGGSSWFKDAINRDDQIDFFGLQNGTLKHVPQFVLIMYSTNYKKHLTFQGSPSYLINSCPPNRPALALFVSLSNPLVHEIFRKN